MKKPKSWIKILLAIALVFAILGMVLMIAGFVAPPLGVIDATVLTGYGETLTFVGYCLGIDYNYRFKSRLHKLDKNEDEE